MFAFMALSQTEFLVAIGAVAVGGAALVGGVAGAAGRSWGAPVVGAVFVTVVALGWVMPVVAGPWRVDCGPNDEATCERFVAAQMAAHDDPTIPEGYRRPFFLPVLSVRLWGCGSEVIWLMGGVSGQC
jgi:hypothetical protein